LPYISAVEDLVGGGFVFVTASSGDEALALI
jgi:hypothetical protein